MTPGIYSIASGLNARWSQQEVSAKNISGAAVNGYKRQVAAFGSFDQVLHGSMDGNVTPDLHSPLPYIHSAQFNLDGGAQKNTGQPFDAAIDGAGFFEVQTPAGPRLTRNGHFSLNAEGTLVNDAGHAVLGEGGPITITDKNAAIQPDGSIAANGSEIARLKVVNVTDPTKLKSEGGELFDYSDTETGPVERPHLNPGFVESSNVELPQEMVEMIQNQRMYDLLTRALQSQDEGLGQGLKEMSS
jgi:flagellar basal-body rod protein FlgF